MTKVYVKTANGWELQDVSQKTPTGFEPISAKVDLKILNKLNGGTISNQTYIYEFENNIVPDSVDVSSTGEDQGYVYVNTDGSIVVEDRGSGGGTPVSSSNSYTITYWIGNGHDSDTFIADTTYYPPCLAEGTLITLADRTQKPIEDITYDDELLVWNFDEGHFDSAKPAVILGDRINPSYNILTFEDGTILKTIIDHRIYSCDVNKFVSGMASQKELPIVSTFTQDEKILKLIKREVVYRPTKYYNLITNYHLNVFANGILTSCRLNNLYPIKDMKFIKDNRKIKPASEFNLPEWAYYAFRVGEYNIPINSEGIDHNDNSVEDYVNRCLREAKKGGNI